MARDRSKDGEFYYSVKTTGVYCRPSCAVRLANPKNVSFHLTPNDAEQAGFRPCLRCRPEQLQKLLKENLTMLQANDKLKATSTYVHNTKENEEIRYTID